VEEAQLALGRPYRITGQVVQGAHRGRTIGFPTANLAVSEGRLLPANGVYATWVEILDDEARGLAPLASVTNIGVRPSFDRASPGADLPRTVETHLLDFEGDLYGRHLGLTFVRRLRPELVFPSVEALRAQIAQDAEKARQILTENAWPTGTLPWRDSTKS
jgi:riboflavin kinase/FMN adenylyltransferase